MGIPDHLTCLLQNLYAGQEATVRTRHGTMVWFKTGKEYIKACHPAYLTYMQSNSWEMPGWMKQKLESRWPRKISIISDIQVTPPLWKKAKRSGLPFSTPGDLLNPETEPTSLVSPILAASWWKRKRRVKKLAWNPTFRKLRSWHLVPSLHGK